MAHRIRETIARAGFFPVRFRSVARRYDETGHRDAVGPARFGQGMRQHASAVCPWACSDCSQQQSRTILGGR